MMYLIDKTKSALGHIKKIVPNVSLRKCHFKSSTRTEIIGTYVNRLKKLRKCRKENNPPSNLE